MNAFAIRKATGAALAFAAIAAGTAGAQSAQTGHGPMMTSPEQLTWRDDRPWGPGPRSR